MRRSTPPLRTTRVLPVAATLALLPWPGGATGAQEVTVTDQRGVKVSLDAPARRIVTFPIPSASLVMAVDGGADRLVGMHARSMEAVRDGILGTIFPDALRVPAAVAGNGFTPNVEAVLALEPDVVLQWATTEDLIAPLENVGLEVVGLRYGTQGDLETWLSLVGALVGRPSRADSIVAWHRRSLDELRGEVAALPAAERPRIVYFNRLARGMTVSGEGTYNDFYIELVGGVNAAEGIAGSSDVNEEQLLAWDPDVVLIGNFDDATPEDLYRRPLLAGLSAVRSRRVYKVPLGGYRWDPPNQESPLMWWWLAALSHPGIVDVDLRARMRAAYRRLYDHALTDREIDAILQVEVNRGAAEYARFGR